MNTRLFSSLTVAAAIAAGLALTPHHADACGGMFCDTGPQAMPVDQRGENILFVIDDTHVEAHIQIQYKGAASRFAWVLPIPALPEISVGSQPLFDAMLQGTVPSYGFTTQFECQGPPSGAGGASAGGGWGSSGAGGGSVDNGGPKVVAKGTAGAFDYVVLQGGTGEEVLDWLLSNQYAQPPSTAPLLQHYLEKNYLFVAIKLAGSEGVDEIHPLVVKYEGQTPCVPLELTAVAAVENMGVRTFFLGDKRWVPTNYKHVELNPTRLEWSSFADNYDDALSKAVDSAVADGRAFVTEYAGTSGAVSTSGVYSNAWNSGAFASVEVVKVVDELSKQGLMSCYDQGAAQGYLCQYYHPLLPGILRDYLPVPAGLKDGDFYSCLNCYADQIDQLKWDGAAFSKAIDERIVAPGKHAQEIFAAHPYLTRMFTAISPVEMTSDPEFVEATGLSDVGSSNIATRLNLCSGRQLFTLPDERQVMMPASGGWVPWGEEMPFAEKITDFSAPDHQPVVLVDNTQTINDLLAAWNASQGWPPPMGSGGSTGAGGGSAGSQAGSGGGVGMGAAGMGPDGAGATSGGPFPQVGGNSGKGEAGNTSSVGPAVPGASAGNGAGTTSSGSGQSAAPASSGDDGGGGCQAGRGQGGSLLAALGVAASLLAARRRRSGR